jgi:hypothetical protein
MVNVGFPPLNCYGFEMVDAANVRFRARKRHQSKIYTESNQSDSSRIFGDLSSMETLAVYRRLLVVN